MKAAVFHCFGDAGVLEIEEVETPAAGDDDVLVNIRAAAVNPKDTFIRKGRFKEWTGTEFPMQTGFDFAGVVAHVGSRVEGLQKGQAVFGMLDGWQGRSCAEFVAVQSHQISPIPSNLTFEEAAALPLVSLTALQALRDLGGIRARARVCINGASGGVGSMAVQIAKLFGAQVTAMSGKQSHALLKGLGADVCIDYHQADIADSGQVFDIFFDVFGNQPFGAIKPLLAEEGIWISTVLKPEVLSAVEATKNTIGKTAKLVIVHAEREDLVKIRLWAESGQLQPVIHGVYPLQHIRDAHRQQETKHSHGKVVISIP